MQELTLNEKIKQTLLNNDIHYLYRIIRDEVYNVINLKRDIQFKFINDSLTDLLTYDILPNQIELNNNYLYGFCLKINNNVSVDELDINFTISNNFELFINSEPYTQVVLNNILINYLTSIDKVHVNNIGIINIINLFYFPKQHSDIPFYSILTNKELLTNFVYQFLTYKHAEDINGVEQKFYKIAPHKTLNNIKKEDINIYDYFLNPIESAFNHVFITQLEILIPGLKYKTNYNDRCCTYDIKSNIPENIRKHFIISIETKYESNNNIPYIKLSTNGGYSKELRSVEDPFDFIDNCLFDIKEIYANWYKLYSDNYYTSRLELIILNQLKEKNFHITKLNEFSIVFSHNNDWFEDIFFNLSYQDFIIGSNINFEEFNSNIDNIIEYLTVGMNNFELANIIGHSNNKINNNKTRL